MTTDLTIGDEEGLQDCLDDLLAFSSHRHDQSAVEVMTEALDLLGNPHESLKVIHITGTSGKTSTAYYVRALLQACGMKTGLTVSPHITAVNERVQIDGTPWDPRSFRAGVDHVLTALEPLRGRLTYFEIVTALALWAFADQGVDYAVVEVGIGGLEDATNVLRRRDKVSLIGPIGLDHTEKLGTTRAQIARHKAGILVPGGVGFVCEPCVCAMTADHIAAKETVEEVASRIGARVEKVSSSQVMWEDSLEVPSYQRGNWAMAMAATRFLARRDGFVLRDSATLEDLKKVKPPARFEWFTIGGRPVIVDGAHNPQKMAGLVDTLRRAGMGPMPVLATLSTAPRDKIVETLRTLIPQTSKLIVPEFRLGAADLVKQSVAADEVGSIARDLGMTVQIVADLDKALDALLTSGDGPVLVTGSLYLAAMVRPSLARFAALSS